MRPGNDQWGLEPECSACGHPGADFGAQLVDQLEALLGLDVPEGPAVAGFGALRHCADAVDRADLVAEHDGAVGADQRAMAFFGIDQSGAGRNHPALDQFGWPETDNQKILAYEHASEATTRRAIKAGVRIAMGSDAVYELFGHNTEELTYLVKSGMTPEQAIAAATVNGAAALGMEKDLGAVTPGHYADLIAAGLSPRQTRMTV